MPKNNVAGNSGMLLSANLLKIESSIGWIDFQLFYEIVLILVAKVVYPCKLKFSKIFLIWVDIFMKRITSKLSNSIIENATLRIGAHS